MNKRDTFEGDAPPVEEGEEEKGVDGKGQELTEEPKLEKLDPHLSETVGGIEEGVESGIKELSAEMAELQQRVENGDKDAEKALLALQNRIKEGPPRRPRERDDGGSRRLAIKNATALVIAAMAAVAVGTAAKVAPGSPLGRVGINMFGDVAELLDKFQKTEFSVHRRMDSIRIQRKQLYRGLLSKKEGRYLFDNCRELRLQLKRERRSIKEQEYYEELTKMEEELQRQWDF
ncbi:hypothetical protein E3J85_02525 [Patescibacteria group bacterium]|nr:MAG: hypothetical protein E3J85_02525 [Patescibacteria group bacterium]